MNKIKIPAIILLIFIGMTFGFMIVTLILGEFKLFFFGGTVLILELILGFVIKAVHKKKLEEEKESKEEQNV